MLFTKNPSIQKNPDRQGIAEKQAQSTKFGECSQFFAALVEQGSRF
jgi:hypothetical protein